MNTLADDTKRPDDPISIKHRTCQTCGMLLDDAGEFHPHIFCILKKAGRDPWDDVLWITTQLGVGAKLPKRPPLIRNLHSGQDA